MTAKIQRDAFLYMEPKKGKEENFAQCSTCMMWTGPKHKTCTIHGKKIEITGSESCCIYVSGPSHKEMAGKEMEATYPEESGLEDRKVRCENCHYFDPKKSECGLYISMNKTMPKYYDLDEKVDPYGCCNANTPLEEEENEEGEDHNVMQKRYSKG